MTIDQILKFAITKLEAKKINIPHLEAEILLSKILKKPREFLLAHGEKKVPTPQIAKYQTLLQKRLKGEPLAYLTGHKEFYSLDFKVNKNVLIPRPETELMVEEALKIATHNSQPITLVDVGTGSGCIIIAILKQLLTLNFKLSTFDFFAIDISKNALKVAQKNSLLNNVNKKIKFLRGNLLEPILKNKKIIIRNSSLVILANLPYLTPAQIKNSPSIKYEPKLALTAGNDGLKYYRKLFQQLKTLPVKMFYVLCEIDPSQTLKIKQLIKRELPKANYQIKKDLRGLNRLVIIKI